MPGDSSPSSYYGNYSFLLTPGPQTPEPEENRIASTIHRLFSVTGEQDKQNRLFKDFLVGEQNYSQGIRNLHTKIEAVENGWDLFSNVSRSEQRPELNLDEILNKDGKFLNGIRSLTHLLNVFQQSHYNIIYDTSQLTQYYDTSQLAQKIVTELSYTAREQWGLEQPANNVYAHPSTSYQIPPLPQNLWNTPIKIIPSTSATPVSPIEAAGFSTYHSPLIPSTIKSNPKSKPENRSHKRLAVKELIARFQCYRNEYRYTHVKLAEMVWEKFSPSDKQNKDFSTQKKIETHISNCLSRPLKFNELIYSKLKKIFSEIHEIDIDKPFKYDDGLHSFDKENQFLIIRKFIEKNLKDFDKIKEILKLKDYSIQHFLRTKEQKSLSFLFNREQIKEFKTRWPNEPWDVKIKQTETDAVAQERSTQDNTLECKNKRKETKDNAKTPSKQRRKVVDRDYTDTLQAKETFENIKNFIEKIGNINKASEKLTAPEAKESFIKWYNDDLLHHAIDFSQFAAKKTIERINNAIGRIINTAIAEKDKEYQKEYQKYIIEKHIKSKNIDIETFSKEIGAPPTAVELWMNNNPKADRKGFLQWSHEYLLEAYQLKLEEGLNR